MNKNYISLSEPIIFGNEIANIKKAIKFYGNCDYSKYLTSL